MADVNHPGSTLTAEAVLTYDAPGGFSYQHSVALEASATLVYDVPGGMPQHLGSSLTAEGLLEYTPTPPRMETRAGATITITTGASVSMRVEPLDPPDGVSVNTQILSPGDVELEFDRYGRPL